METRKEHLDWCKKRALEYVDLGDTDQALASMMSDLTKHPETEDHIGIQMGMMLSLGGHLSSPTKMREWIVGFN